MKYIKRTLTEKQKHGLQKMSHYLKSILDAKTLKTIGLSKTEFCEQECTQYKIRDLIYKIEEMITNNSYTSNDEWLNGLRKHMIQEGRFNTSLPYVHPKKLDGWYNKLNCKL